MQDNNLPKDIEEDVNKYYANQIFYEVFNYYEFKNYNHEKFDSIKDDIETFIGDDISLIKDAEIIESINTRIGDKDITIMLIRLSTFQDRYSYNTVTDYYVKGKLNEKINGTIKITYDEEELPTGEDEFSDYYTVECNNKVIENNILSPELKELFVNLRDMGEYANLYINNDIFLLKMPSPQCSMKTVKHWKINKLWASERYNLYIDIYNVINLL